MAKSLRIVFFATIYLFATGLNAQSILGKVTAQADDTALPGAHISLLHPWGEIYKTTISDADGNFEMADAGKGGFKIKISYLGFQDYINEVTIRDADFDLGIISMKEGVELDEVEVKGKVPIATQLGDTTQFNAESFKTLPDASAEDLIAKMPGVIVENGKVQAQGEDVKEVLVDGRPFFGNDPTAALRNLPAEVIDKIQVFDQKSDQAQFTGFDDGETSKTINIITKVDMRTGQFGKLYAGYGSEDRYRVGGNASLFSGDRRISLIGQSNNINQQNFATEDLLGVVGGNSGGRGGRGGRGGGGRGGRGGGGGSVNDFMIDQQGGIAQTHAAGINYSDKWGKKFEISGSYFLNMSDRISDEYSSTQFIDDVRNEIYDETYLSSSDDMNHRLNMKLEYDLSESSSLIMRPRLSFQDNMGLSNTFGQTYRLSTLSNQTDNAYNTDLTGTEFSNNLLFRHRFPKRGRTVSVNVSAGYNDKIGESLLRSFDEYYTQNIFSDTIDQFSNLNTNGWNLGTGLSYTEPLGENSSLMLSYRNSLRKDDSDKETSDYDEGTAEYTEVNEQLSNVFENQYTSNDIGVGYNYRKGRDFFAMVRTTLQFADLKSDEKFPLPNQVNRSYTSLLPFAMMRFNLKQGTNLMFSYRERTQSPSVDQLQNVLDNSNPLQLSIGNENLDQSRSRSLFMRYSSTNSEKATAFFFLVSGSVTSDYIANSTYLSGSDDPILGELEIQRGAQLSQPVNLNGYRNLRSFITYGIPLSFLKSNLNFDISGDYNRIPGMIDKEFNYSNNAGGRVGLTLASNISEKVDFTISSRTGYNVVTNSIQSTLNDKYWTQSSRVRLNAILPAGLVIRTDLTQQVFTGLADSFNETYYLWNVGIGKKVFKNQRGEFTLSIADLLNQNQSISRNVTETYIQDIQTNVLQRYVMLSFTYHFKNFGAPATRPESSDRDRRERWMGRGGNE